MTHLLTDEMLWKMAGTWRESSYCDGCRTAADWQLERDVEFFKKFLVVSLGIYPPTAELMAQDFKAVMRPQEES